VPDLIWASPPCNTFSTLAYPLKERHVRTAEPYSERAKQGTQILHRTLEIIEYYQRFNPNLVYVIENPKGMMRFDSKITALPHRSTTLYCLYEDVRRKPTDFFNNVSLSLKDPEQHKCDRAKLVSVVDLPLNERYKIPKKLVKDILVQMVVRYRQNKRN
jgi:site-specific DNA-cytosine methylase